MGIKTGNPRGRPKGSPNKATTAKAAEIAASGLTPLDYMLGILRDLEASADDRKWAAAQAAPYVHPRLGQIESRSTVVHEIRLLLDQIDTRTKGVPAYPRLGSMNGGNGHA